MQQIALDAAIGPVQTWPVAFHTSGVRQKGWRFWRRGRAGLAIVTGAAALSITGCDDDTAVPPLAVTDVTTWHVPPDGTRLPGPRSIAAGLNDEMVVLDNAGRVLIYDSTGQIQRVWAMPEFEVGRPEGVVVLTDGRIVVCDTHYHRIVVFDGQGTVLSTFGSYGRDTGQFIYPVAVTADANDHLYIGEYGGNDRIQVFTSGGAFVRHFGGFGTDPGEFQRPSGIVWDDGIVFVADAINNRVQKFTDAGEFIAVVNSPDAGLHFPYDITMAPDDSLYVIEYGAGRLSKMTRDGVVVARFGSTGRGLEQFVTPWGIAADSHGRLRIADTGNRRVIALETEKR